MIKVLQYGAVFLLLLLVILAFVRAQHALYRPLRRIRLGDHPLWEFMAVDETGRHLFISSQLQLMVIHLDTDEIIATLHFPHAVYGIALVPGLNKGFVCHRAENIVSVFDLQTLQLTGQLATAGAQPEGLLYDAVSNRLFTCNGRGRSLTAIDPVTETVLGDLPLPGKPAFAVPDGKGNILVSVDHSDEWIQADAASNTILHHWQHVPGEAPGGVAFDLANGLMFSVYDGRMIVTETGSNQYIAAVAIGNHPGTVIFDPTTALLYCANGDGSVTIIKQLQRNEYKLLQRLSTQAGSRSMALDPVTKKLYLPGIKYQAGRKPIPGSFELLVFGSSEL
jgi:DNA-binding beta-propeller fold protein YncE